MVCVVFINAYMCNMYVGVCVYIYFMCVYQLCYMCVFHMFMCVHTCMCNCKSTMWKFSAQTSELSIWVIFQKTGPKRVLLSK